MARDLVLRDLVTPDDCFEGPEERALDGRRQTRGGGPESFSPEAVGVHARSR